MITSDEITRAQELVKAAMGIPDDRWKDWYKELSEEDQRILTEYTNEVIGQINSLRRTLVETLLPVMINLVEAVWKFAEATGKAFSRTKENK